MECRTIRRNPYKYNKYGLFRYFAKGGRVKIKYPANSTTGIADIIIT